jgi:hypothetical protein
MEQLINSLKTSYRRTTGCKCVQNGIMRYGRYVAFVDHLEIFEQLLDRLKKVPYEDFARERQELELKLAKVRKEHRFHHKRQIYLDELEQRWTEIVKSITTL